MDSSFIYGFPIHSFTVSHCTTKCINGKERNQGKLHQYLTWIRQQKSNVFLNLNTVDGGDHGVEGALPGGDVTCSHTLGAEDVGQDIQRRRRTWPGRRCGACGYGPCTRCELTPTQCIALYQVPTTFSISAPS